MIHYHQYAVKASALREARDEIHGDLRKWGCVLGDSDFVKGGAAFVREILVLLANSTPLHVLLYPGS